MNTNYTATENELLFEQTAAALPTTRYEASGIPDGFNFNAKTWQVFKNYRNEIEFYAPSGGVFALRKDGTWDADIAPFAD
jgi:hypothetical protein